MMIRPHALLIACFCLVLSIPSFAQKAKTPPPPVPVPNVDMAPLAPIELKQTKNVKGIKSYEDSAEFAKAFKEIYPLVKPKQSVKEMADQYYSRMSRGFAKLEMDSVKMYKMAMANLDTNSAEKLMFDTYRKNLSAKELKAYIAFLKSAEGKKIMEVMPQLERAKSETNGYVSKTINTNIAPLRQQQNELMKKEMPPLDSVKGPDGKMIAKPRTGMDSDRMRMRDSIMKARKLEMKDSDNK